MRLEAEPRIEQGASFMFSLKDWMRRAAQLVNGTADKSDASASAIGVVRSGALSISSTLDGPAFSASLVAAISSAAQGAYTTLALPEDFDSNGCYDPTTGRFTPNVPGRYQINAAVYMQGATAGITNSQILLFKNGAQARVFAVDANGLSTQYVCRAGSTVIEMNGATDYLQLAYFGTCASGLLSILGGATTTGFSGFLARRA
jgi:hypothetical protein